MKKYYSDQPGSSVHSPKHHSSNKTNLLKSLLVLVTLFVSFTSYSQYCNSNFTSVTFEFIKNVNYAGINNSSSGNTGGPVNYTTQIANVTQGITNSITITIDDDANDYVYVFIDWNQNGTLNDAGETYTVGSAVGSGSGNLVLPAFGILTPMNAVPGITRMRVMLDYGNATANPCRNATWGEAEDYSVNVISSVPCTGAPPANAVTGPTYEICPGSNAGLGLSNTYTLGGITYAWFSSTTSSVGPWTAVTGTAASLSAPNQTISSYFMAVATCSAGGTTSTTAFQVTVQPVVTNTPPYFEGFENIASENKLPNCSWSASSLGGGLPCQTYTGSATGNRVPHNGSRFASFYYSPGGTNYFYTNGIYLTAGVTYSAALWYTTEYYGYNNWTDLSILYGPNQSPTGLTSIVSTNGPAISNIYKLLSNTFSVPTTGIYYIAVRATGNTNAYAEYLSWDDLSITIPCTPQSNNSPTLAIAANATTLCAGQTANLLASGADTYTWNTGDQSDNIVQDLNFSTNYQVVGTNTLTGCTSTLNQSILVNPAPQVYLFANKQVICAGESVMLTAVGGLTYSWTAPSAGSGGMISVSPATSTTYSVSGANTYGCSGMAMLTITVNPLPTVSATSARPDKICAGESVVLTATGGSTFSWISNTSSSVLAGSNVTVSPTSPTNYTVTGTDINGCSNVATVAQNVESCIGIAENTFGADFNLYPNPSNGEVTLETAVYMEGASLQVLDVTGKIVFQTTITKPKEVVDLKSVSNGIYFVKLQSQTTLSMVKLVKQ